ncbi:ribonuclease R [Nitrosovibrio sp. Nv6]|uniref:ribonuclease R n=1 Tax=Nitrosovibrio sp. Nv6 TaxID=1855340 RepID=UPI0008B90FF6|nr:ribonuclease R [Nitrosovibrio sp. Nv6]SEO75480.1 ribonuclease R [Nitrosovibrio sp. Nv6]
MSIKKKRKLRDLDPKLEREKARYGHALPSREFILQILEEQGIPVNEKALQSLLEIAEEEHEIFGRRISAMLREGQIMRNRKGDICVVEKLDLIKGKVQGHPDGFGFLVPDDDSPDLFLSAKEMHKALHGDRVMVREIGVDRRGRREGTIVEVLERAVTQLVGRLHDDHGILFVEAENRRISQDILIPREESMNAKAGKVVMVEIIQQPSKHAQPIGRIIEILGEYTAPGMEIEIALRKHDLPHQFPPEVEKRSAKFPDKVLKTDLVEREDIRHLPLVTIDGETARDFDDAVYCERDGKDYKLYVAIADVSHYVSPRDALDQEAFNRGNSIYFPRRVIPMLPEALSNGLCSLNPQVERLCMVCEVNLDAMGNFREYRFYPAVMFSHARLTYTKVAAMLDNPKGEDAKQYKSLLPHIQLLYKLFKVLLKARAKRGAIDFETIETQMIFNDQGKIERILPVKRNDAHRLIEECMLAANVCASDFLQKHKQSTLYRIHEGPTPEKLLALRDFLKEFGVQLSGGDEPHAKDYAKTLTKIKDRPDAQLLQTVMLRSLRQAVYSPDNVGHFGLAYESYTHFTSPIRRYPDLLVHRAIKAVLNDTVYSPGNWHELGAHCSQTERRADDASRDVETWLKCYYMQDRIGESFDGVISAVTGFGLFVALDGIYVEGLVHISELPSDYFHFDAAKHRLLGERSGKRYRLGDRLRVTLVRVDLESSKIDFVLAEHSGPDSADSKARS